MNENPISTYYVRCVCRFAFDGFCASTRTMISGTVSDDIEPLMMVNVVEVDEANRIVAHGVTDINGNFSFRIVNPKHRLKISYVGYATQLIPIKGTRYNIKLKSNLQLKRSGCETETCNTIQWFGHTGT